MKIKLPTSYDHRQKTYFSTDNLTDRNTDIDTTIDY